MMMAWTVATTRLHQSSRVCMVKARKLEERIGKVTSVKRKTTVVKNDRTRCV